jgi:hypothetical protein
MKRLLITFILLGSCFALKAQINADTIAITPLNFYKYYYHDIPLSNIELSHLVINLPEAQTEFKKFQTYKRWALITSITALALLPWALHPDTQENTREAIGYTFIGLELITIPLHLEKFNHKKKAVRSYNRYVLSQQAR